MDLEILEARLAELPLLGYFFIDPKGLEFSDRIRFICETECPMYGKTWACPPVLARWKAAGADAKVLKTA